MRRNGQAERNRTMWPNTSGARVTTPAAQPKSARVQEDARTTSLRGDGRIVTAYSPPLKPDSAVCMLVGKTLCEMNGNVTINKTTVRNALAQPSIRSNAKKTMP
jgi:hypothetical protein